MNTIIRGVLTSVGVFGLVAAWFAAHIVGGALACGIVFGSIIGVLAGASARDPVEALLMSVQAAAAFGGIVGLIAAIQGIFEAH